MRTAPTALTPVATSATTKRHRLKLAGRTEPNVEFDQPQSFDWIDVRIKKQAGDRAYGEQMAKGILHYMLNQRHCGSELQQFPGSPSLMLHDGTAAAANPWAL